MADFTPEMEEVTRHLAIGREWSGLTLVAAVRRAFPQLTTREIFKKTRTSQITVGGARRPPLETVSEGELVAVVLLRPKPVTVKPVLRADARVETPSGPLIVVHEDEDLLAVSKPAGCASHPALGRSLTTLIDRVRHLFPDTGKEGFKPALANRLDIDTSGIVLVGKNQIARARLGRDLQLRRIEKRYLTLVAGSPPAFGEITTPLERKPDSRALARLAGGETEPESRWQEAHTRFRVIRRASNPLSSTLVEVELLTGRTHQIRRHFAEAGYPVALDKRYGDPEFNRAVREALTLDRMFLHAYLVRLPHPATRNILELVSPLTPELSECLTELGLSGLNLNALRSDDGTL